MVEFFREHWLLICVGGLALLFVALFWPLIQKWLAGLLVPTPVIQGDPVNPVPARVNQVTLQDLIKQIVDQLRKPVDPTKPVVKSVVNPTNLEAVVRHYMALKEHCKGTPEAVKVLQELWKYLDPSVDHSIPTKNIVVVVPPEPEKGGS